MKQKYVLIGGFTLIFTASLGLILFERGQSQVLKFDFAAKNGIAAVRGADVALDNSLALYRQEAITIARVLTALADNLAAGQAVSQADLGKIFGDLLATNVPAPYRNLHFKLTTLVSYLKNNAPPDADYLREQIRLLKAEFPWL